VTHELRQTRLPGVGTKFSLELDHGGRLAVIQHNDGMREVYAFRRRDDDEPAAVITLDDDEARASMAAHNLGVAAQIGMDATLRAYLETFDLALRGRNGTSLIPSPQAQTAAHEA